MIAFRNIIKGEVFDENFLMSVATIGALAIGEYPEAVAVMIFYQIGEVFQGYAVNRSRNSITSLMNSTGCMRAMLLFSLLISTTLLVCVLTSFS